MLLPIETFFPDTPHDFKMSDNRIMKLFILFFITLSFNINAEFAEFKLNELNPYLPGNVIDKGKPELKKAVVLDKEGEKEILLLKYQLPKFYLTTNLQVEKNEILDSYFRFPNNYSHDIVLTLLQKQFGKQTKYYKKNNDALYWWLDKDFEGKTVDVIYHGSCSLTCFPLGIHFIGKKAIENPSFTSLYQKFNKDFPRRPQ